MGEEILADPLTPEGIKPQIRFVLGMSYNRLGDDAKARQQLELVVADKSVSGDLLISAYQGLGKTAEKQNRPADAAKAFAQQRALLIFKAVLQANAKDFDSAIATYRDALSVGVIERPVGIGLRLQIGAALEKLGKYDEARSEFQSVFDEAPFPSTENPTQSISSFKIGAYLGLARVDIAEQKFDSARETLNRALQTPDLSEESATTIEALLNSLPPKQ